MNSVDQAIETQLKNIQSKSGKSLADLSAFIRNSGLTKHSEIRDLLKRELGLGYGDANSLAHYFLKSTQTPDVQRSEETGDDVTTTLYNGAKADLRPIHDQFMAAIAEFGPFESAPKKTYISLRRKKQFAMIGPATKTRVEVGINAKDLTPTARLIEMPTGGMCQYKVNLTEISDVDQELLDWIKLAYERAG